MGYIRNVNAAALRDLGTELTVGDNLAVDGAGRTIISPLGTAIPVTSSLTAMSFFATSSLAFGSITTSMALFASGATVGLSRIIILNNRLDKDVYFALDASTSDQLFLASMSAITIDLGTNGLRANSQSLRVRSIGSNPTSGTVYFTGLA